MKIYQTLLFVTSLNSVLAQAGANEDLLKAFQEGNREKVRSALKNVTNINIRDKESGETPLMEAAHRGMKWSDLGKLLIEKGADATLKANDNSTALLFAARSDGDPIELAQLLLAKGANPNDGNNGGETPLLLAIKNGNSKIALKLLEKGADARFIDGQGETLLHHALSRHFEEHEYRLIPAAFAIIKRLVAAGANINAQTPPDEGGRTPLMIALSSDASPEIIKFLLEKGANVTVKDNSGATAFSYASMRQDGNKIINLLRQYGPSDRNPDLLAAAHANDLSAVKKALEANADINAKLPPSGVTALMVTTSPEILKFLLEKHANINEKSAAVGATALIDASFKGKLDIVRTLLAYNPDVNIKDNSGRTALDYAQITSNEELQALLRSHGAKHGEDLP